MTYDISGVTDARYTNSDHTEFSILMNGERVDAKATPGLLLFDALTENGIPISEYVPPPVAQVLSQDLMAQFTADDAAKIQAAVSGNVQFWLLWQSLTTQKDPMLVNNARFLAGWSALVQALGADRMAAIAAALGVTMPREAL